MTEWRALMEERGTRQDLPMKPQVVAWELGKRLADNAICVSDSGTITTWWARLIKARERGRAADVEALRVIHAEVAYQRHRLLVAGDQPHLTDADGLRPQARFAVNVIEQLDAGTVTLSLQPGATGWVDIVCGRRSVAPSVTRR